MHNLCTALVLSSLYPKGYLNLRSLDPILPGRVDLRRRAQQGQRTVLWGLCSVQGLWTVLWGLCIVQEGLSTML